MSRIWNVRLNLDEFSSEMGTLDSDSEAASFLRGMWRGLSGGDCIDGKSDAWQGGWRVGNASRVEAEAHREASALGGRKSQEKSPGGGLNKQSANRPPSVPPSEVSADSPSDQSTIDNRQSIEPVTTKPKRIKSPADKIFADHGWRFKGKHQHIKAALKTAIETMGEERLVAKLTAVTDCWVSDLPVRVGMVANPKDDTGCCFEEVLKTGEELRIELGLAPRPGDRLYIEPTP